MVGIIKDIEKNIKKGLKKVEEIVEKPLENIKEGLEEAEEFIEDGIDLVKEKLTGRDLEKAAEEESTKADMEKKKEALLKKVEKLKGKINLTKTEDLKEKVKEKKRLDMLIPLDEYVKAGIYIGTKVVTPQMRPFVYRRRADGLAIFNTDLIDEKLKEGVAYLSKFAPKDVIVVCKRQAGWKVVQKFSEITGIRAFTNKYPAGILTNTTLPDFFEADLAIISDSWLDKNAFRDMQKVNKKILMICDTNNFPRDSDQIVIGNNKSPKSLGVIYYLLARGYCKARKIDVDIPELEWWVGEH